MDFPLGAEVHCKDGRCGRSTFIVYNPVTDQLTHVVVREQQPSKIERLVPTSLVKSTAADVILLNCDRDEFFQLEPFNQTHFVHSDLPHYATDPKLTLLWPFAVATERMVDSQVRSVPEGELTVRRGAKVSAVDGFVGRVEGFVVNPENCQITHLVIRDDRLWIDREVVVPLSFIDRIQENQVYLNIKKGVIEELPDTQIEHDW